MISRVRAVTPSLISIVIDREGAVRPDDEPALIEQVIQLNRDAVAVRFVDAEADRPEARGEERRVDRSLHRLRHDALVDHVLQGEQAGDVGLRFLEEAGRLLHLLPHGRLPPVHRDVVRAEAVHQLVHQDVREERVEGRRRPDRPARARPSRSAPASSRTSRPGRSSASRAWRPSRASRARRSAG